MTNSEWFKEQINNASDEELARCYASFCNFCAYQGIPKCYRNGCEQGHLDWLQAEHGATIDE